MVAPNNNSSNNNSKKKSGRGKQKKTSGGTYSQVGGDNEISSSSSSTDNITHQETSTMEEQEQQQQSKSSTGNKKQRPHIFRRRRSSKGMIAGFVSSSSSNASNNNSTTANMNHHSDDANDNTNNSNNMNNSNNGNINDSNNNNNINNSTISEDNDDENNNGNSRNNSNASEGSVSSRLALFCVNNAIAMGARTQLSLCPPGKRREELRKRLLNERNTNKQQRYNLNNPNFVIPGGEAGLREYEAAEEAYLLDSSTTNQRTKNLHQSHYSDGDDLDDHPSSSGDEDELDIHIQVEDTIIMNTNQSLTDIFIHNNRRQQHYKEPLYVPAVPTMDSGGVVTNSNGTGGSKLPFNFRKLKWFDQISAADRAKARLHLKMEMEKFKKQNRMKLQLHLRQMQRQERNKLNNNNNINQVSKSLDQQQLDDDNNNIEVDVEEDNVMAGADDCNDNKEEEDEGFSILPQDMTPALSAALVLESLLLRPLESLDGMAKLYEGIVSAGTALLDAEDIHHDELDNNNTTNKKPTKSEVFSALTACLLTTLEQSAGDTILALAKLRQNCGTPRYQRRFVHRVAPCLVRPPNAAIWCLRHQKDMESIMAATEMILDAAPTIFAPGWWEKGRALRADSQRAETLKNAANQLKRLSANNSHHLLENSIDIFRLNGGSTASSSFRRRFSNSFKESNHTSSNKENLAEWEVLSVDRQIRTSINYLFTRDWSKDFTRDGDLASVASSHNRSKSRGISAGKIKAAEQTTSASVTNNSFGNSFMNLSSSDFPPADISPTLAIETSPLSPRFSSTKNASTLAAPDEQLSSQQHTETTTSGINNITNNNTGAIVATNIKTMNYSFSSPPTTPNRRSHSPQPEEDRQTRDHHSDHPPSIDLSTPPQTPKSIPPSSVVRTPPRSPSSPPSQQQLTTTTNIMISPSKHKSIPVPALTNSPSSHFNDSLALVPLQPPTTPSSVSSGGFAPLSPSAQSSYNKKMAQRAGSPHHGGSSSSGVSVGSSGSSNGAYTTGYLRSLTSTSDERKRTVAACRALRSQIARFEADFQKLHGRPPKGPLERAPLATTYAQYREWKKAIRADAACRIQALLRGARTRDKLSCQNHAGLRMIVRRKLGRRKPINIQLQIPHDIGGSSHSANNANGPKDKPYSSKHIRPTDTTNLNGISRGGGGDEGVEAVISPNSNSGSIVSGNSSSLRPRRSSGSSGRMPLPFDDGIAYTGSGPLHRGSSGGSVTSVENSFADMSLGSQFDNMSISDLKRTKRQLKEDLKQYDKEFYAKHKRMPVKAEKEPIRHLYERYNGVKHRIAFMEKGVIYPSNMRSNKSSSRLSDGRAAGISSSNSDSSGGEDPPAFISPSSRSSSSKKKESKNIPAAPTSNSSNNSGSSGNSLATELEHLKMEKNNLHQMLRNYEKDFFRRHNRQVSSYTDIQPVASQYRRYKDIKKSITKLQSSDKR